MTLRGNGLGALNLFQVDAGGLAPQDLSIARALADIATIGLVQQRNVREAQNSAEQLQYALHSRITIEQAKGMLAERAGVGVDDAFTVLRTYSRNHNRRITGVASDFLDGVITVDQIAAG
jgi:AmiR/NasT family two-component response regulator